jgi:hypothetical protein
MNRLGSYIRFLTDMSIGVLVCMVNCNIRSVGLQCTILSIYIIIILILNI